MSALAHIFTPAPLRYRDLELSALCVAKEVRYHDKRGALAFRISEAEVAGLARVAATAGRASVMLFLFLKIVASPISGPVALSVERIAEEIGGASTRDIERILASLLLSGLARREAVEGGFKILFPRASR